MKHDNGGNPSEGNGMVAGDDDDAQESFTSEVVLIAQQL